MDELNEVVATYMPAAAFTNALESEWVLPVTMSTRTDDGDVTTRDVELSVFGVTADRRNAFVDVDINGRLVRLAFFHEQHEVQTVTWRSLCTVDPAQLLSWIDERMQPLGVSDSSVLGELPAFGIEVSYGPHTAVGVSVGSALPRERVSMRVSCGPNTGRFDGRTWESVHGETRAFGGLIADGTRKSDPMVHRPDASLWAVEDVDVVSALAAMLSGGGSESRYVTYGTSRPRIHGRSARFFDAIDTIRSFIRDPDDPHSQQREGA